MGHHGFSLLEILASNRYITVENRNEIDVLSCYITYRVERDLYEVCQENGLCCGLSWADFVFLLRQHKPARTAAIVVVRETLRNFYAYGHYNFDGSDVQFTYDDDPNDDMLRCASLFSSEEGQSLIEGVLFRAEVVHYKYQLRSGKCRSWHQYLDGLKQDRPQWDKVIAAYHDALARLDFKPIWKSEKLEELVMQTEMGE